MTLQVNDRLTSEDGTVYVVEQVDVVGAAFQVRFPLTLTEVGALQVRLRPEEEKSNAQ